MKEDLLERILQFYANSRAFNGLHIHGAAADEATLRTAIELVEDGLVQVMSDEDYPNPHIRPWPSKRSIAQQVGSIQAIDSYGVCPLPHGNGLEEASTNEALYRSTQSARDG